MSKSIIYSFVLHILVFLVFVFGMPSFWKPAPEDTIITLELLPVTGTTNLKPKKTNTTSKFDEVKKDVPKSADQKPEVVDDKNRESKVKETETKEEQKQKLADKINPDDKKESTTRKKEEDKKKKVKEDSKKEHQEEKNKKDKKKTKDKKNKQKHENDFDSLLKTLEESTTDKKSNKKVKNQKNKELDDLLSDLNDKSDSNDFNDAKPLSLSEEDAIRSQIEKHWNVPAGAKDAKDLIIKLKISIKNDGTVTDVKIVDERLYLSGNTFYVAATDSAMRAAHRASPLQNLPTEKYNSWKEIELSFNPKNMLQ